MSVRQPAGAPMCYGRQYEDRDQECQGCDFKDACRPEFLRENGMLTAPAPQPQPISPYLHHRTPSAPVPIPSIPVPIRAPQPVHHLPVLQPQRSVQAPATPIAPVPQSPVSTIQTFNPYFAQHYQPYPGETTFSRVGTHIGLRLGFTLFSELARFCEVWRPEPPSGI